MTAAYVTNLAPPPIRVPLYDRSGLMSAAWVKWFELLWTRTGGTNGESIYDALDTAQASSASEAQLFAVRAELEAMTQGILLQLIEQVQEQLFDPTGLISDIIYPPAELPPPDDFPIAAVLQQALDNAAVQSVFGRTGDVVATEGDYTLDLLGDVAIAAPSSNQVLSYNGSSWVNSAVPAAGISGIVPVANGGTGASSLTANNVILGNGASPVAFVAPGTSGNILKSNGTTWVSTAASITAPGYEEFSAAAAQTIFNTTINTTAKAAGKAYLQIFVNGVFQQEGATKQFTVTGANQVTFNAGLVLNDDVVMYSYS